MHSRVPSSFNLLWALHILLLPGQTLILPRCATAQTMHLWVQAGPCLSRPASQQSSDAALHWGLVPPAGAGYYASATSPRSLASDRGISLPTSLHDMKFNEEGLPESSPTGAGQAAEGPHHPMSNTGPLGWGPTGMPQLNLFEQARLDRLSLSSGSAAHSARSSIEAGVLRSQLRQPFHDPLRQPFHDPLRQPFHDPHRSHGPVSAESSFHAHPLLDQHRSHGAVSAESSFRANPAGNTGLPELARSSRALPGHVSYPMHGGLEGASRPMPVMPDRQQYSMVAGDIPDRLSFLPRTVSVVSITRASSV